LFGALHSHQLLIVVDKDVEKSLSSTTRSAIQPFYQLPLVCEDSSMLLVVLLLRPRPNALQFRANDSSSSKAAAWGRSSCLAKDREHGTGYSNGYLAWSLDQVDGDRPRCAGRDQRR